jgi:O-antigen ligase
MNGRAQVTRLRQVVEAAALLLLLWAPICFDPRPPGAFESAKTTLVWLAVAIMAVGQVAGWLFAAANRLAARNLPTAHTGQAPDHEDIAIRNFLLPLVLLYVAIQMVATLASIDVRRSLMGTPDYPRGTITLLCLAAFSISLADTLRTERQVHRVVSVLLAASLSVVAYGLVQAIDLDPLPWVTDSASPVHSTIGRSNYLGAYLAMLIPFALWRLSETTRGRWRYVLLLVLQVGCLALTLARAAWLGAVVGCAIFLALLAYQRGTRRAWGVAMITLLVGFTLFLPMNAIVWPGREEGFEVAATRLNLGPEAVTLQSGGAPALRTVSVDRRTIIWRSTTQLVIERPLLGYGPAMFDLVFNARYLPGSLYSGRDTLVTDPHNLILDQLMSAGIAGLLAFAAIVVGSLSMVVRSLTSSPQSGVQVGLAACAASIVAYLVQALATPDVILIRLLFWTVLALTVALKLISLRATSPTADPSPVHRRHGGRCARTRW